MIAPPEPLDKYCGRCGCKHRELKACPDCGCPEYSLEPDALHAGWLRRQMLEAQDYPLFADQ